ncbi:flagellar protein FlgJ [Roseovarius sp. MBR-78]|uniref:rod-binding protein n=1 Tax=Roseovarius sp. MBR-78 TaxID=3156460 RepID=UPI003392B317
MLSPPSLPITRADASHPTPPTRAQTRAAAAQALEASFLAEMLKATGLGEQENSFTGSAGESQFASFHREAIAAEIVRKGGIGLAKVIEAAMKETQDDIA